MPSDSPAALVIDRQQRSVLLDGRPVVLGGRAFDVLAALTARPGQVCSVQALHQAVWPDIPVDPNNLRVQIATLRQRFSPQHIDNVVRRRRAVHAGAGTARTGTQPCRVPSLVDRRCDPPAGRRVDVEPRRRRPATLPLLELPRAFALERLGLPRHSPTVEETPPLAVSPLLQRLVRHVSAGEAGHAGNPTRNGSALDPQAVLALALRLQPDDLRQFDTAVVELQRAVELAASVVADSDDDGAGGDTDHVLQAVAEQTRLGQLDRGAEELYTALVELQRRDERRRAAMQRSQRALLDACVRQDLLRRDAPAVARHIETLAALNGPARPSWAADHIEHETRYLDDGMRLGHRLHLQVGVALARRRLETATDPAERLAVQHLLVRALLEQGSHESTHATLQAGVQLARQALQATDRTAAPLDWAALQHSLGGLLHTLSYRTGDSAMMEDAEACSRLALQERTAERTPLDWADSQRQLAGTLRNLGQREASNQRVLEAAAACRAALHACPVAQAPQLHAQLQDMLATTLIELGRRELTLTLLQQAVLAARHALAAISPQQAPHLWGDCNSHLGIALGLLGNPAFQPDGGLALQALRDAVVAFQDALGVSSPDGDAVAYAMRLHNLAAVLRQLGACEPGLHHLVQSASHSREALVHFARERFPMYWAAAQEDLSSTLHILAKRQAQDGAGGTALDTLELAAQAASQALLERPRERSPLEWAQTTANRAQIWLDIGRMTEAPGRVQDALDALGQALDVFSGDGAAVHRKQTQEVMGEARAWLSARRCCRDQGRPGRPGRPISR